MSHSLVSVYCHAHVNKSAQVFLMSDFQKAFDRYKGHRFDIHLWVPDADDENALDGEMTSYITVTRLNSNDVAWLREKAVLRLWFTVPDGKRRGRGWYAERLEHGRRQRLQPPENNIDSFFVRISPALIIPWTADYALQYMGSVLAEEGKCLDDRPRIPDPRINPEVARALQHRLTPHGVTALVLQYFYELVDLKELLSPFAPDYTVSLESQSNPL